MNLKITGAFNLAAKAHGHQTRKYDGSSYTLHLREVYILLEYAGVQDEKVLIAGLLHDTLEDTALTAAEIEAQFGSEVCSIVQSLTDDKTASFASRKAAAIVKVRTLSGGALSIKLADLISNMTAIPAAWDAKKLMRLVKTRALMRYRENYSTWRISSVRHKPVAVKSTSNYATWPSEDCCSGMMMITILL